MTRVLGLDLSLTASGYAFADPQPVTGRWTHPEFADTQRLALIRNDVISAIYDNHIDVVVLEGYSFNSKDSHAHALGELGGVVKLALAEAGVPYAVVAPALVKKFATGKGNAKKFDMQTAALKRAPEVHFADDNAVDAWWLQQMGLSYYVGTRLFLPLAQVAVLDGVEWPELKAAV